MPSASMLLYKFKYKFIYIYKCCLIRVHGLLANGTWQQPPKRNQTAMRKATKSLMQPSAGKKTFRKPSANLPRLQCGVRRYPFFVHTSTSRHVCLNGKTASQIGMCQSRGTPKNELFFLVSLSQLKRGTLQKTQAHAHLAFFCRNTHCHIPPRASVILHPQTRWVLTNGFLSDATQMIYPFGLLTRTC